MAHFLHIFSVDVTSSDLDPPGPRVPATREKTVSSRRQKSAEMRWGNWITWGLGIYIYIYIHTGVPKVAFLDF